MIRIVDGVKMMPEVTYSVTDEGVLNTTTYADGCVHKSVIIRHEELISSPDEFINRLLERIPGSKRG